MIWKVLWLAMLVHASSVPKERSIEYIQADGPTIPSRENISLVLNISSLDRPLIPGQGLEVTLIRAQAPQQFMPAGALGHHLLSIVQLFWRRADNEPQTAQVHFRDDDFRNILTQITPNHRSRAFTPLNLAKGFDAIAKKVFREGDYRIAHFRWYYRDVCAGDTKTATLLPPTWAKANHTEEELAKSEYNSSSANAPTARTRFTGVAMEASQVLILFREMLAKIWEHAENDPITRLTAKSGSIVIVLPDTATTWKLRMEFLEVRSQEGPVTCYDISNRFLRALQLPAYLDRWETLESDFLIGSVKIASISLFREGGDMIPETAKRALRYK